MASTIIHIAVAKKVLEEVGTSNPKDYYLGSIAPDLSKQLGDNRVRSHFFENQFTDIPNIKAFCQKYPDYKTNSFNLGYFVHLYTDKLWAEDFLIKMREKKTITFDNGTTISTDVKEFVDMLYTDYTNLNIQVINKYDLELSLFYEDFIVPDTNIEEIPVEKLDILINKMSILIENSKGEKSYLIDISMVEEFIEKASKEIINYLQEK